MCPGSSFPHLPVLHHGLTPGTDPCRPLLAGPYFPHDGPWRRNRRYPVPTGRHTSTTGPRSGSDGFEVTPVALILGLILAAVGYAAVYAVVYLGNAARG